MWTVVAARRAWIALAVVVGLLAVACYDIKAPPEPTSERIPTIVGQIVGGTPTGFELSSSEVIDVYDPAAGTETRTRLGTDPGSPPRIDGSPGGLILAGEDSQGRFYAATRSPEDDGCFRIFGPGYLQLDRDRVHLSSGLVLELADEVERTNNRTSVEPSWLFEFDRICLDESGHVTLIEQSSFGA